MKVAVVPRRVVRPLQLEVLRPGQELTEADLVDEPGAFYVAAYDESDEVAGVATFLPEPHPDAPGEGQWRLRGMASASGSRGGGFGSAALRRGLDEVRDRDGLRVWCNARIVAVDFYVAHGFVVESGEFDVPGIGPHVRMSIPLT